MASHFQTKPFMTALLISCLLLSFLVGIAYADAVTEGTFNLDFSVGESFVYEDEAHNTDITFTVSSGSLTGTATLAASASGGVFTVTPSSNGVLSVSSSNPAITIILINYAVASSITFSSGVQFQVTWSFNYTYYPPVIVGGTNNTLYFRSDTFYCNNITGYGLHTGNTATYATVSDVTDGNATSSVGFRVWHVNYRGNLTELTTGTPNATVTRLTNSSGYQYGGWACSEKTLTLGADALKVIAYIQFGSGDWEAVATFITNPIAAKAIFSSTWNFSVYTTREYNATSNQTTATFVFGSLDRTSAISGIIFWDPTPQEVALALGLRGDWVQMVLYPFLYLIGDLFYGCGLLFLSVTYYLRFKRWEPVLIMILLFGGGGLFGYLIPNIAYRILYVVVLFVIATQLYRLFS